MWLITIQSTNTIYKWNFNPHNYSQPFTYQNTTFSLHENNTYSLYIFTYLTTSSGVFELLAKRKVKEVSSQGWVIDKETCKQHTGFTQAN